MQLTSIPSSPTEIEATATPPTATPQGNTVDFAAVLATLLVNTGAAPVVAAVNAAAPAIPTEEPVVEEASEDAEFDGVPEASSDNVVAGNPPGVMLASALVATTPLPPVTLSTPPPTSDTPVDATPVAAAASAKANTNTVQPEPVPQTTVEVEVPAEPAPPSESEAPAIPTPRPQVWIPVGVSLGDSEADGTPTEQSTATYTVQPSAARTAATMASVPPHDAKVVVPSTTPPTSSTTPVPSEVAPATMPTPQAAALVAPAATSAALPPTPEAAAPPAAPTANVVLAADVPNEPATAGHFGDEANSGENPSGKAPKGEPAPNAAPTPVLERHAVVLARNALNEQVRGASARELLANAREVEAPAERTTDTSGAQLLSTPMDHTQRAVARATTAAEVPTAHATLPTLGEDLVKHVAVHSAPGERTITLRLTPESLGDVQVEIRSTSSELSVRLISQDGSVRDALEQHAVGLRESLARDGRETRIEIGSQLNSNFGQTHDNEQSGRQAMQQEAQGRPRLGPPIAYGADSPEIVTAPAERRGNPHVGVLNLFA